MKGSSSETFESKNHGAAMGWMSAVMLGAQQNEFGAQERELAERLCPFDGALTWPESDAMALSQKMGTLYESYQFAGLASHRQRLAAVGSPSGATGGQCDQQHLPGAGLRADRDGGRSYSLSVTLRSATGNPGWVSSSPSGKATTGAKCRRRNCWPVPSSIRWASRQRQCDAARRTRGHDQRGPGGRHSHGREVRQRGKKAGRCLLRSSGRPLAKKPKAASYARIQDSMPSLRRSRRTSAGRHGIASVEPSRKIRCLSITSCDREADMALWSAIIVSPLALDDCRWLESGNRRWLAVKALDLHQCGLGDRALC